MSDPVNHPSHYTSHPSGVECIQVTEHMGFCIGNAIKYLWRADLKADAIEDLKKARWYIERELQKRGYETAAEVEHPRRESEWMPVEEAMPPENVIVVVTDGLKTWPAYHNGRTWAIWFPFGEVPFPIITHWTNFYNA